MGASARREGLGGRAASGTCACVCRWDSTARFTWSQVLTVASGVASALQYLHFHHICHGEARLTWCLLADREGAGAYVRARARHATLHVLAGDVYAHNILVDPSSWHATLCDFGACLDSPSLESAKVACWP